MAIIAKPTIDSPVSINIRRMNYHQLSEFLNHNEFYEPLLRRVELYHRIAQYAHLRLALIQPTTATASTTGVPPTMEMLRSNTMLRDRFLRFVINLQQDAGLNPITVPFMELSIDTLKSVMRDVHRSLTGVNLEPIFFVDLKYYKFDDLVSFLTDELGSKLIGLIYRRRSLVPVNYDFLGLTYYDRDVAFLCVHVDRYDIRYDDISTPHYMPFFGADMYAVESPPPFHEESIEQSTVSQEYAQQQPRLIEKIRFFHRSSLKVKPIDSGFLDPRSILEDMRAEDRDYVSEVLENREEANTDQSKYRALNALSRFHELRSSVLEFQDLQKRIDERSARDYVTEKSSLELALAEIKKHQ